MQHQTVEGLSGFRALDLDLLLVLSQLLIVLVLLALYVALRPVDPSSSTENLPDLSGAHPNRSRTPERTSTTASHAVVPTGSSVDSADGNHQVTGIVFGCGVVSAGLGISTCSTPSVNVAVICSGVMSNGTATAR